MDLSHESMDAHRIFYTVRYQLITGPGSAIDVNHLAIWRMIDELQVKNRLDCFEKVIALCRQWWIPKLNEKSEA